MARTLLTFDHGYAAIKKITFISFLELLSTGVKKLLGNAHNILPASIASYHRRLIYTY
jgi:hypothetical protein